MVDVTEIALNVWKNGNKLCIPTGDINRINVLGDPIPDREKNIFVTYGDKWLKYSSSQEVKIIVDQDNRVIQNIPIVIICFNNYKYVRNTIVQLKSLNILNDIIILDNKSDDSDTIEYLSQLEDVTVIWNETNNGPRITLDCNVNVYNILPDKFILTDPDLQFNTKLPYNFTDILAELSDKYNCYKIGFALDISDFDKMYQYDNYIFGMNIYDWEKRHWGIKIDDKNYDLYIADVDTTFCLTNKNNILGNYIRVAGDFTAKHLPWYVEDVFYNISSKIKMFTKDINTISTTFNMVSKYSSKKISIIMGYYNRKTLLIRTLNRFKELYGGKYNIEIVIVDDMSSNDEKLNDVIIKYPLFDIKLIEILEKTHINPVIAYNQAIKHATGEIIILQNPEIFHCDNIIDYILKNLGESEYFVFPIFNSPSDEINLEINRLFNRKCNDYYNNFIKKCDEQLWYIHKIHAPRYLHFLSAIYRSSLDKVGGFNNEMKDGIDYDDDDFGNRVSKVCDVKIIDSEKYIGIHQWHPKFIYSLPNSQELRQKNYNLYINNQNIYCDPNFDIKTKIYIN